MGNRAVITAYKGENVKGADSIGIYLHWNGGYDSVAAFLKYCELEGYRMPESDNYGWARLCQVIGNFFGGSNSVGVDRCCNLDCENGDNGVYVIKGWKIVGRKYANGYEQLAYDPLEMLKSINESMPASQQLEQEVLEKGAKELEEEFESVKN